MKSYKHVPTPDNDGLRSAVPSPKNKDLYEKYKKEAEKVEDRGIYFVGRLAK